MKKILTLTASIAIPLVVCIGLPYSLFAQAGHDALPLSKNPFYQWLRSCDLDLSVILLPFLVAFIVYVVIHNRQEDQRLNSLLRSK